MALTHINVHYNGPYNAIMTRWEHFIQICHHSLRLRLDKQEL